MVVKITIVSLYNNLVAAHGTLDFQLLGLLLLNQDGCRRRGGYRWWLFNGREGRECLTSWWQGRDR